MEKIANWGYLRYKNSTLNTREVFKRIRRIRGKNIYVHGVDAKRLLTYSRNAQEDIKVCLSQLIIIQIINFLRFFLSSFYLHYMGWIKPKNHPSHATVPLKPSKRKSKYNQIYSRDRKPTFQLISTNIFECFLKMPTKLFKMVHAKFLY